MIGTVAENNDVHVFFENDDLSLLAKGKVKGTYVNSRDASIGSLEVSVDDAAAKRLGQLADFTLKKDAKDVIMGLEGYLTKKAYETLLERNVGLHLGFAHINLVNAEREMSFHDRFNYEQLKKEIDKKNT